MGRRSALGKGAHRPEPKHTTAFATRANLTLTLEDEPESE